MISKEERVEIPKLEGYSCFACGTKNPIGLNLRFYLSEGWVCSDVHLTEHYAGWDNMAHGGIISTILDEIMAWALLYFKRGFFVTRRMEIKYVKPVLTGVPLLARGKLIAQQKENLITAQSELRDETGSILSRATGMFYQVPAERLSMVPETLKQQMAELFEIFKGIEPAGI